jgi:hypothetical protein
MNLREIDPSLNIKKNQYMSKPREMETKNEIEGGRRENAVLLSLD